VLLGRRRPRVLKEGKREGAEEGGETERREKGSRKR
jgi:hypothetical protein